MVYWSREVFPLVPLVPSPLIHFTDISHTKLRIGSHTHVHLANSCWTLLNVLATPLCPANNVSCATDSTFFRISVGTTNWIFVSPCLHVYLRYSMSLTTNCGFPFDSGLLTRSKYFFEVLSDLCFFQFFRSYIQAWYSCDLQWLYRLFFLFSHCSGLYRCDLFYGWTPVVGFRIFCSRIIMFRS